MKTFDNKEMAKDAINFFKNLVQKSTKKCRPLKENLQACIFFQHSDWINNMRDDKLIDLMIQDNIDDHEHNWVREYKIPKNSKEKRNQILLGPLAFLKSMYIAFIIREKFDRWYVNKNKSKFKVNVGVDLSVNSKEVFDGKFKYDKVWKEYLEDQREYISHDLKVLNTDFTKCYPNFSSKKFKKMLTDIGFSKSEKQYINEVIKKYNNGKEGLPQNYGSSPFDAIFKMFLQYVISKMPDSLNSKIKNASFYVDDGVILLNKGIEIESLKKELSTFFKKYGLKLNNKKTKELESIESIDYGSEIDIFYKNEIHGLRQFLEKVNDNEIINLISDLLNFHNKHPDKNLQSFNSKVSCWKEIIKLNSFDNQKNAITQITNIFKACLKNDFPKNDKERLNDELSNKLLEVICNIKFLLDNIRFAKQSMRFLGCKYKKNFFKLLNEDVEKVDQSIIPYFQLIISLQNISIDIYDFESIKKSMKELM